MTSLAQTVRDQGSTLRTGGTSRGPAVGLESGGFSAHELREDGALGVYRDARELVALFRTSRLGHLVADP